MLQELKIILLVVEMLREIDCEMVSLGGGGMGEGTFLLSWSHIRL
jgi:hypothetical protein